MIHNSESGPCIAGSILGMSGALIYIIAYIQFKKLRNYPRKLIFVLSIYDFLISLALFLPGYTSTGFCKFQVYMIAYFLTSPSYWCFVISIIFLLKFYGYKYFETQRFFNFAHILMHIISITLLITYVVKANPTSNGRTHWCWIKQIPLEILIYVIYWFLLLGCILFYSIIIWKVYKAKNQTDFERGFQFKMFLIPLFYVFTAIFSSVKRLREMINPDVSPSPFLDFTQGLFLPTEGFWDFVLFVLADKETRNTIARSWFRCCCKPKNDDTTNSDQNTFSDLDSFKSIDLNKHLTDNKNQNQNQNINQNINQNQDSNSSNTSDEVESHSDLELSEFHQDNL
ncbi:g protein-coupled receptor [Anaeramoeba ignava]|uniref:G protein-coupled receptor n=1 Tax=Anaeramoeba ignava TaxID=1746090 RepID=A0A9Q0LH84_ANAIG|nr:g protein-coupled receptor [Anaeramoeba ignava]